MSDFGYITVRGYMSISILKIFNFYLHNKISYPDYREVYRHIIDLCKVGKRISEFSVSRLTISSIIQSFNQLLKHISVSKIPTNSLLTVLCSP